MSWSGYEESRRAWARRAAVVVDRLDLRVQTPQVQGDFREDEGCWGLIAAAPTLSVQAPYALHMHGTVTKVVESLVGGLFTSIRPYLPYTAATTLAGIKLGGAAFGPAHGVSGGGPLPFAAAAALVAAVAVLFAVVAARTTLRRDVT